MPRKDPEKRREYEQQRREENPSRVQRWREENCAKDRETKRRYYVKRRDELRKYAAQYYQQNAPAAREYAAQWRAANPEYGREWEARNRAASRAKAARRRARKAGATIGDPAEVAAREAEIRKSRWCVECEAEVDDLHVDHIWPLSKGGAHSVENLQGLCARHNLEKGARVFCAPDTVDVGKIAPKLATKTLIVETITGGMK